MGCAISTDSLNALSGISYDIIEGDFIGGGFVPDGYTRVGACPDFTTENPGEITFTCIPNGPSVTKTCCIDSALVFEDPGGTFDELFVPDLVCDVDTGMMGEPHIKKWNGEWYDWQGEVCFKLPFPGVCRDATVTASCRYLTNAFIH
jgi:hypothetical protein